MHYIKIPKDVFDIKLSEIDSLILALKGKEGPEYIHEMAILNREKNLILDFIKASE